MNKNSMKVFKDLAGLNGGLKFIRPHEKILRIPGAKDARVFALGPPRDADQIADMGPQGDESFRSIAFGAAPAGDYFSAAVTAANPDRPFANRFCISKDSAMQDAAYGPYLSQVYGSEKSPNPAAHRGAPAWNL